MPPIVNYIIKQNPASKCPPEIFNNLVALRVPIWTPECGLREGIVEVHRRVVPDIEMLFKLAVAVRFPIVQARPICEFDFDDLRSMLANNTSAFNRRTYISKSDGLEHVSEHSFGACIDINPFWNPDMQNSVPYPAGAVYLPSRPGTLTADSPITKLLKALGWKWGGDWEKHQDYQHFEKPE